MKKKAIKPSKVFKLPMEHVKCGGCNWEVDWLFVLADDLKTAKRLYRSGDAGLCGECFSAMLEEYGFGILSPEDCKALKLD